MKALLDREDLVFNPPELSCVLYLPGLPGGGSKIYDRSPYANIGTITGATWVRLPSGLWCLSFDGTDDYVNCGKSGSMDFGTDNFAIEFWTKGKTSDTYVALISKSNQRWSAMTLGWNLSYYTPNNSVYFCHNATANVVDWPVEGTYCHDEKWHFWVLSGDRTAGTVTLYRDGVSKGAKSPSNFGDSIAAPDNELRFGRDTLSTSWYKGIFTLPRIYRNALTALEVQSHFNREKHLFGVW